MHFLYDLLNIVFILCMLRWECLFLTFCEKSGLDSIMQIQEKGYFNLSIIVMANGFQVDLESSRWNRRIKSRKDDGGGP